MGGTGGKKKKKEKKKRHFPVCSVNRRKVAPRGGQRFVNDWPPSSHHQVHIFHRFKVVVAFVVAFVVAVVIALPLLSPEELQPGLNRWRARR